MTNKDSTNSGAKEIRKTRRLKRRGRMYIDPALLDPSKHYHIANHSSDDSTVRLYESYGYTVETDERILMGLGCGMAAGSQFGSVNSIQVGRGMTGILMSIPIEEYNEAQQEIEAENRKLDQAVGLDVHNTMYGGQNSTGPSLTRKLET